MSGGGPVRILIAAMGGEGGGVLAGWITNAAIAAGLWAQRTSIPGVAQRTGATTYYLELLPRTGDEPPVLALSPAPGRVDVLIATELLEATRMVQAGFVTAERTLLVASSHRVYSVDEKSELADGRLDDARLLQVVTRFSHAARITDFAAVAAASDCHLNAVLLGVLAATGAAPIAPEAFRDAIRAGGKAVEANLRGFEAGLALPEDAAAPMPANMPDAETPISAELEAEARAVVPEAAQDLALAGLRRVTDYQGAAYARLYLDRIGRIAKYGGADAGLLGELARHLALRMSFEDTIRVAELKLRAARLARVRAEAKAKPGDIVDVVEYFRPGPDETLSMLPSWLARPVLRLLTRLGWGDISIPLEIKTTRAWGYVRLRVLAGLKGWRPRSLRHEEEQEWIERWLDLVGRTLEIDPGAAREIVEAAGLLKGYGATYRRGRDNWERIAAEIIEPALAGRVPKGMFAEAVMQARLAALAAPEGDKLSAMIASFQAAVEQDRLAAE